MRIVMAGSSGFLGTALRQRLRADGHELVQLVRRPPKPTEHQWWPDRGELDPAVLAGADAVVNLAGAGVEDKRWTEEYKRELRMSRVRPTATLAQALATLDPTKRPAVLLNSSAIGIYGDRGDEVLREDSPSGQGFFPDLCRVWEAATTPAEDAGVRVVKLRTGLVLDASGGLLKPLIPLFQALLGGKIGDGQQWMAWMTLRDWTAAAVFVLERADLAGPINFVGPAPARNVDFTKALGAALHRPTHFPTPKFGVRLVMGEFGNEAVASQRVLPDVLSRNGFTFQDADLASALRTALARVR